MALGDVLHAAICARGHVQNPHIEHELFNLATSPRGYIAVHVPRFCGRCGAKVLLQCQHCGLWIAGQREDQPPDPAWQPAAFWWGCGRPYPWATREQLIGQLYNLLDFEDLDEAERLTVVEQIAVLSEPVDEVTDEDRVRAGQRIRNLAPKAWDAFLPVLQGLLTAEAKQQLGLP